jgi:dihydrofolate reductase (trimethoprim resistance protein)
MPKISLVAAMAKNRVIGNGLDIPWKIKGEQLRFKTLTTGKVMVMGRLTYQSIGRPLPNRTNVILTRDPKFKAEGCEIFSSMEDILNHYQTENEIMIAGGGQLYAETIQQADRIHLTIIDKEIEGDIFFPDFNLCDFKETEQEFVAGDPPYTYYSFERIKKS